MIAEAAFVSITRERPPMVRAYFNVTLHQSQAQPMWYLLPSSRELAESFSGHTLNVYHLDGQVVIGHLGGTNGFRILRLPPNAQVTLKNYPVQFWGDPPANYDFEVISAREVLIDGESIEGWFGIEAVNKPNAVVNAEPLSNQREVIKTRSTPTMKEANVTLEYVERSSVSVAITI